VKQAAGLQALICALVLSFLVYGQSLSASHAHEHHVEDHHNHHDHSDHEGHHHENDHRDDEDQPHSVCNVCVLALNEDEFWSEDADHSDRLEGPGFQIVGKANRFDRTENGTVANLLLYEQPKRQGFKRHLDAARAPPNT